MMMMAMMITKVTTQHKRR